MGDCRCLAYRSPKKENIPTPKPMVGLIMMVLAGSIVGNAVESVVVIEDLEELAVSLTWASAKLLRNNKNKTPFLLFFIETNINKKLNPTPSPDANIELIVFFLIKVTFLPIPLLTGYHQCILNGGAFPVVVGNYPRSNHSFRYLFAVITRFLIYGMVTYYIFI